MTITTALYSGNYYNLTNSLTGDNANHGAATTQATPSLLDALGANKTATSQTNTDSYLLDLSPQAQSILNGSGSSSSTATGSGSGQGFVLSKTQQEKLQQILGEYSNLPVTQDNYKKLQADLKSAGLSPDQLSLQDNMRNFSATKILVEALSGKNTDSAPVTSSSIASGEQDNADQYMSDIVKRWQSASSSASPTVGSAAATDD